MLLDEEGVVFSWGKETCSQLGYELIYDKSEIVSGIKCQAIPRKITHFIENKISITNLICGRDFTFAFDQTMKPYSWGNNDHGQLARKTSLFHDHVPQIAFRISSFENICKIVCGWFHAICLLEDGQVYMWGNPYTDYQKKFADIIEPYPIPLEYKAINIASGFHHMCAVVSEKESNELYTWGANEYGQLGYKTNEDLSYHPKKVDFESLKIKNVACGSFHTVCTMTEGRISAFGHN